MMKTPPAGKESGTTGGEGGEGGGEEGGGEGEGERGKKKRYCLSLHSQTTVSVDLT